MATSNPPNKNEVFVIHITLEDAATGRCRTNPTIASGDFKISKDGGAFANLATLPVVEPSGSVGVRVELSATEMNADSVLIVAQDQTSPNEWNDWSLSVPTTSA